MGKYLAFLLLCSSALGQDVVPEQHGVFRIVTPNKSQATAFVVAEPVKGTKILATAAHVTQAEDMNRNPLPGKMWAGPVFTLESDFMGKVTGVECVAMDEKADIALVIAKIDKGFTILPILALETLRLEPPSTKYKPAKKPVSFYGYAAGRWTQTDGELCFVGADSSQSDAICVGGMSGGPMVVDGCYTGTVSGGQSWYTDPDKNATHKTVTWPARAGASSRLKANLDMVMARYKK